jgi:hypothetical protein
MAVNTDYTGRTVDFLIFQGVKASGVAPITLGLGLAGEVCTGVQKVAQTWLSLFMTDRGTVLNKPTRGSSFIRAVRTGRIRVDDDVRAEFALAASQVRQTMGLDAVGLGLPDDERLDDAVLLDFTLDRANAWLQLKVRIRTAAGDSRNVILPVPVTIV